MAKKGSKKSTKSKKRKISELSRPEKIRKRFSIALKNLIIFAVLLILFFVLSYAVPGTSSQYIFQFISVILFFIVLAFFISLIVLSILKQSLKKKNSNKKLKTSSEKTK